MKKSLHNDGDVKEILDRINFLSINHKSKWGRMNVAQMLEHCSLILKIATGEICIKSSNFVICTLGAAAKYEMQIFNSGIPHNMPTFKKLIVNFDCDFESSKQHLIQSIKDYLEIFKSQKLPHSHPLFGKMTVESWGFFEYKHLDHHLKQFNI
ncbi:DUF1569 domain-containing protein [Chryseobacterium sp. Leaf180]|uniref:DUF1569 domain-containing protein n=1 Tax=Chryseobacterium sp. Leaf180 TaxID=1736289 RepID=UPI0009E6E357|nr:DUF1569 domain-containing protein [Chryseobacterium sp. Leaf180]